MNATLSRNASPDRDALLAGERAALARAITLVESDLPEHQQRAEDLLASLLPHAGGAIRLGITGAPGVGKSTFIEALGMHLVRAGRRVAVLAVDPSSRRSGGSIMGDKTRMEELSRDPRAFVRPSPAGRTLGGVARRTREAMLLCEAAGFDVAIVETVGVGQSEAAVAGMVDMFLLLIAPGGGDELQGIKRGIVEAADLVVVNKADGELRAAAGRIAAEYTAALGLLRPRTPHWKAGVVQCSALEGSGIDAVWQEVERYRDAMLASGARDALRAEQMRDWLWAEVTGAVLETLASDPEVAALSGRLEAEVRASRMLAPEAARQIVAAYRRLSGGSPA